MGRLGIARLNQHLPRDWNALLAMSALRLTTDPEARHRAESEMCH
jgi:hypothetical protein